MVHVGSFSLSYSMIGLGLIVLWIVFAAIGWVMSCPQTCICCGRKQEYHRMKNQANHLVWLCYNQMPATSREDQLTFTCRCRMHGSLDTDPRYKSR